MQDVFLMFLLWHTVSVAYRFSALTHIFQPQLSVSSLYITNQFKLFSWTSICLPWAVISLVAP